MRHSEEASKASRSRMRPLPTTQPSVQSNLQLRRSGLIARNWALVGCVAILTGGIVHADTVAPAVRSYEKARCVTSDGVRIAPAFDLRVDGDSITFSVSPEVAARFSPSRVVRMGGAGANEVSGDPSQRSREIDPDRVRMKADLGTLRYIEVRTGNEAGRFAAYGAGMGLVTGALAVAQANSNDLGTRVSSPGAWIAGCAIGLGMLGLIIGSANDVYRPVRDKGHWVAGTEEITEGNRIAQKAVCRATLVHVSF